MSPRRSRTHDQEEAAPEAAAAPGHAPDQAHGPLVLVVEDDPGLSRVLSAGLTRAGFRVETAFDGREGYERAIALSPDLIVTDVVMPRMNGDALVRALRERAELRSVPIVVLTAGADEDRRADLLRSGVDDYLVKPIALDELIARIRNLTAQKRAGDDSGRPRNEIEDGARDSKVVSGAVASLPTDSVLAMLQTIALKAQSLTSAEFAAVGLGNDPGRPFETWAFAGLGHDAASRIGTPPRPIGVLGLVAKHNRAIRVRDVREHPDYRGFPDHHPLMTSFIGVPITHRDRAIGSIYVTNKRGTIEFSRHDQQLVEMLAESVGVTIETARRCSLEGAKRAWLDTVVDQMPEGIVVMNAEGRVTLENRFVRALAAEQTQPPDRFGNRIGLDLRWPSGEPVSSDDLPIVKALIERETVAGHELVARRADGELVPLLVCAAPIRGATGDVAGAAMILEDISPLKLTERLREEWSSIVAHDLQQPIQAILLRINMLLRDPLNDAQANHVRHVRISLKRLGRMVHDLMDASQIEAHRLQIAPRRLDLGSLVRDIVKRDPNVRLRTRIRTAEGYRLFVRGDAERLEQVVTNLLSNALKYGAPDTNVRVDIGVVGEHARVSVSNRGPGIPADEIPQIFERHVRSRAAKMGPMSGLGLGLYIARGLVEAHGGQLWAESVPHETTTFHFTIPLDGPPIESSRGAPAEGRDRPLPALF